jgi:hypothetical protein
LGGNSLTNLNSIGLLSLYVTAQRVSSGEILQVAVKEHVDAWNALRDPKIFIQEPPLTELAHVDAWLAGAAHYQAYLLGVDPPSWVFEPCRFLSEPHFPRGINSRMIALVETPFAFRMRMVFCGKTSMI